MSHELCSCIDCDDCTNYAETDRDMCRDCNDGEHDN